MGVYRCKLSRLSHHTLSYIPVTVSQDGTAPSLATRNPHSAFLDRSSSLVQLETVGRNVVDGVDRFRDVGKAMWHGAIEMMSLHEDLEWMKAVLYRSKRKDGVSGLLEVTMSDADLNRDTQKSL
jgi:hypothetical protein